MKYAALSIFVVITSLSAALACSGAQQPPSTKTTTDLRTTVEDFHIKMRWGMWEQAAAYVSPTYKPAFEARYDELGDDFKISNLEIRNVTSIGLSEAFIDVEQESYKEPEMTVKEIRYIETWSLESNVWRLTERIEKDEWEKRKKAEEEAAKAAVEAADAEAAGLEAAEAEAGDSEAADPEAGDADPGDTEQDSSPPAAP